MTGQSDVRYSRSEASQGICQMTAQGDKRIQARSLASETLKLIDHLELSAHPANFTLFYHYLIGDNPELNRTVDILRSNHQELDDLYCLQLHQRFFGPESHDNAGFASGLDLPAPPPPQGLESDDLGPVHVNDPLISTEISRLRKDLERMRREAMTDPLTGLANRKMFDQQLRDCAMEAMEIGKPMCLMMVDADHFKSFNDTFGHQAGDQVIRLMAQTLKANIKGRDTAARYGGEEFAVILPQTDLPSAARLAQQIRCSINLKKVICAASGEKIGPISVSIGVGEFEFGEPIPNLIERTDRALYHAKAMGRNRVASQRDLESGNKTYFPIRA